MAEGETSSSSVWPGPVTFNDKDEYASIFLTVPDMKQHCNLRRKIKSTNTTVEKFLEKGLIHVKITVINDGMEQVYEYKKNAPEDIDEKRCSTSFEKGYVVIKVVKVKKGSWGAHSRYLIEKPK